MNSVLGIGAAAGLVAALLFAVISTGNVLALVLYFVAPLPIFLAALGWNHTAVSRQPPWGARPSRSCSARLRASFSPPASRCRRGGTPTSSFSPAPTTTQRRVVPARKVLFWMSGVSAGLTLLGALMLGRNYEAFVRSFERAVVVVEQLNPNMFQGVAPEAKQQSITELAQLFAVAAPPVSAAAGVAFAVLLAWLAARITLASGRLPRPWPEIAATQLPQTALWALLAGSRPPPRCGASPAFSRSPSPRRC